MTDTHTYRCSTCGEIHVGLPDLSFDVPLYYEQLPKDDRNLKAVLTADTCVIENEHFFVRGCLEIPVRDRDAPFTYGVWVSLSPQNFKHYQAVYDAEDRPEEGPFFGWLSTNLPGYPTTLNLKTNVYLRRHPLRPRIQLEPTEHPLAVEQCDGITLRRLQEIIESNNHPRHV